MSALTTDPATDQAVKDKHRAMWALGDYPAVAREIIPALGPVLVNSCRVEAGQRVLDVAAGSGNAAIPASLAGANVTALDLVPELLDAGRRLAAEQRTDVQWQLGDAEAMPFPDDAFDVVMSCLGVMFAPHHESSADELVRVCRPGGTIGLLSWTPAGFVGQMFATMKPYASPPPPGSQPPPLWGDEVHVRTLLGDRVEILSSVTQSLRVDAFGNGEEFRDYFKTHYGPTIATYRGIADDPTRVTALDDALVELVGRFEHGDGATVMDWDYLVLTATKR